MTAQRTNQPGFRLRLDARSGVPFYRQIIDQVQAAIASGALRPGDQLPTVRQLAVDLSINPNTVIRAYREMEIRGTLQTQQGSGTFISEQKSKPDREERQRLLHQIAEDFLARAGAAGFDLRELVEELSAFEPGPERANKRR